MEIKQYLIDTFKFNDSSNKQVLEKVKQLPDKSEAIRFYSHLINSQNKWLQRILHNPKVVEMDWWEPLYGLNEVEDEWNKSLEAWIDFLQSKTEDQLYEIVNYIGNDGGHWQAPLKDIALQLNYHSIHHRAQIQTIIRKQGLTPDFVDYITTVYKKLS